MYKSQKHTILKTAIAAGLLATVALTGLLLTGCGKKSSEAAADRRDITAYLPLEGKAFAPATGKADIGSNYLTPVAQIYVTVGQAVKKGETLILFSAPTSQAYYQQARASLVAAQNALAQAKKQYGAAVNAAQSQLAASRSAERSARETVPNPDLYTMHRQANEQDVIDAQAAMAEGLVPYQQALVAAQEQFRAAQAGAKAAQVKSPIDGIVLAVNAKIGAAPDPESKEPLVSVVNLDVLKIAAGVAEDRLDLLHPKDPAVVTVKEIPNVEFTGHLQEIYSEKAGFLKGQKYTAVIDFRNSEGRVKPGMDAQVSIKIGEVTQVIAVPANAVYTVDNNQSAVKVKKNGKWIQTIVEAGLTDTQYTEIKSGLEVGDVVMTNP